MGQASVPASERQTRAPRRSRDRKAVEVDAQKASGHQQDESNDKQEDKQVAGAKASLASAHSEKTIKFEESSSETATAASTSSAATAAAPAVKSEHTQPAGTADASSTAPSTASANDAPQPAAPARRQTTRMRKPSSRLLPSPSPPPPQRSSYYNYLNKSNSATSLAGNTTSSSSSNGKARKSQSSEPKAAASQAGDAPVPEAGSSEVVLDAVMAKDAMDASSGKRKRRPSSMTKPPSTITKAPSPQPASVASTSSSAAAKQRQRSVTKEDAVEEGQAKSSVATKAPRRSKGAEPSTKDNKGALQADGTISSVPKDVAQAASSGYDSDGNAEGALLRSLAGPDADDGGDEDSDIEPQGKSSKRSVLALARKSLLSSTQGKSKARANVNVSLEPPPLISRRGGLKVSQSALRQMGAKADMLSTPPSVKNSRWSYAGSGQALPLLRFRLDNLESHADDEDSSAAEDEDDFHVAMLSGCDLDMSSDSEIRKSIVSPTFKGSPRVSQSHDGSDTEYTPATTPQSPRSTCDPATDRRSSVEGETTTTIPQALHDAVFAHALEPSSRRPHTHAGLLTLSLPFEEIAQAHDEDGNAIEVERPSKAQLGRESSARRSEGEGDSTAVESEMDTTADQTEHETVDSDLLSTSSQPLGFSAKHAALVLSSPNPCSAFPSPNVTAMRSFDGSDPGPLLLPTSGAHLQAQLMAKSASQDTHSSASKPLRSSSLFSTSAMDVDTDGETEHGGKLSFGGSLGGFHPPESLCLSELDRAWEISEGRSGVPADVAAQEPVEPAQKAAIAGDGSSPSSEADVEQIMGGETSKPFTDDDDRPNDVSQESITISATQRKTRKAATIEKIEGRRASKRGRESAGSNVVEKVEKSASTPSRASKSRRPARRSTLARSRA